MQVRRAVVHRRSLPEHHAAAHGKMAIAAGTADFLSD
jgi:hypothetical protein